LFKLTTSWVGTKRLNGLVVKPKIFDTTGVVLTTDTWTNMDDYGRGAMFGGITRIGLEGNTWLDR
jgi:uncharacterized protein (DUF849 family)